LPSFDEQLGLAFVEAQKRCRDCGVTKPVAEFGRNRERPDGLAVYCKPCFRDRSNQYYEKKRAAQGRQVRRRLQVPGAKRCASCDEIKPLTQFHRARSQSGGYNCYCKTCRKAMGAEAHLLKNYGMTRAELEALVDAQDGLCAICVERPAVHVDHDHATGQVRGVLCFPCNAALGQFRDRTDLLARAATYLETTTWQKTRVCTGVYRLTSPRPAARPSSTSSPSLRRTSSPRGARTSPRA
jgi:hypothetical protein